MEAAVVLRCIRLHFLVIVFAAGFTACSNENSDSPEIHLLRVAVLPDQSPERLEARYGPLLEYIKEELDTRIEFIVPVDYQDQLDRFHRGEIDLARFGGYSFVKAMRHDGAVPVVMRDVDARFSSYFLVRGDDPATDLVDFRGKRLSFGSRLSTSGHLMPRYFLQSREIFAEEFFASVLFSGAHDATAYSVRDGRADVGAANALVVDQLYREGLLSSTEVRILWKTPVYADYVWVMARHVPFTHRIQVQNIFLALTKSVPNHAAILKQLGAGYYLPAYTSDFSELVEVAEQLDLLDGR